MYAAGEEPPTPTSPTKRVGKGILLVGLGNPLCRDDGVGYRAALELESQGFPAIALTQPLPELAHDLAQAERVIFLDADVSLPPGEISLRAACPTESETLSHNLAPEGLLALAGVVSGRIPASHVLSLGVADLSYGEGFSPQVAAAFAEYLRQAQALLEDLCTS